MMDRIDNQMSDQMSDQISKVIPDLLPEIIDSPEVYWRVARVCNLWTDRLRKYNWKEKLGYFYDVSCTCTNYNKHIVLLWCVNDKFHREAGPAEIIYHDFDISKHYNLTWYLHGIKTCSIKIIIGSILRINTINVCDPEIKITARDCQTLKNTQAEKYIGWIQYCLDGMGRNT